LRVDTTVRCALWGVAEKFPAYCEALIAELVKAGLTVDALKLPAGEFSEGLDMVIGGWIADYPDADSMVRVALHTRDGLWGPFCGHASIDDLCERAGSERDP